MACTFPSRLTSKKEWLAALKLEQHVNALAEVQDADMRQLIDARLKELGIAIVGHRRRILIGLEKLGPRDKDLCSSYIVVGGGSEGVCLVGPLRSGAGGVRDVACPEE